MEGKILKTLENRLLCNSASGKLLQKPDRNYFRLTFVGEGEGTITVLSTSFMRVSLNGEPWVGENNINYYYPKTFNVKKGDVLYFCTRLIQRSVYGPNNSQYGSYIGNNQTKYFFDDANAIDYEVSGNIMSLLYPDFEDKDVLPNRSQGSLTGLKAGFGELFYNCKHLVSAYNLEIPIKTWVTDSNDIGCYSMFRDCTNMKYGPKELPATTLCDSCYHFMFANCTNMKYGPKELPATTLTPYCYYGMFDVCKKLKDAPLLRATTLADSCCMMMFASNTELKNVQKTLYATTLADSCYRLMFYNCSSLKRAPILPAKTLTNYCYAYMFAYASLLNYIWTKLTSWNPINQQNWVTGVASSGEFFMPYGLSETLGSAYIPTGWTAYWVILYG